MILLDTNVVSEIAKERPSDDVIAWLNAQASSDLFLSSVTLAETAYGFRIMPPGRRRDHRIAIFERFIAQQFSQPILTFDEDTARAFGDIVGARRQLGRPMSTFDGQIAAIARVNHLALATRNVKDFEDCGLELINPFTDTP